MIYGKMCDSVQKAHFRVLNSLLKTDTKFESTQKVCKEHLHTLSKKRSAKKTHIAISLSVLHLQLYVCQKQRRPPIGTLRVSGKKIVNCWHVTRTILVHCAICVVFRAGLLAVCVAVRDTDLASARDDKSQLMLLKSLAEQHCGNGRCF